MPKKLQINTALPSEVCSGGRSYNCKRAEHKKGAEVRCYRCSTLMGCVWCCEIARELICLVCNNWATKSAIRRHGNVVPNYKVQHVRADNGWLHYNPAKAREADLVIRQANEDAIGSSLMDQEQLIAQRRAELHNQAAQLKGQP